MRGTLGPRLIVVSLLMLAVPSASVRGDAASEGDGTAQLLDQHIRWRGGRAALERLKNVRLVGTLRANQLEGTIEAEHAGEGWSRVEYDLQALSRLEVLGPDGGFAVNPSGQIEPLSELHVARLSFSAVRAVGAHLLSRPDITLRRLPPEEKEGRRWEVLRFTRARVAYDRSPRAGVAYDLFVDPKDGSAAWARETEDTQTVWTHFEDWRDVQGVQFPHVERTFRRTAADNVDITWKQIQANVVLADRFARPTPRREMARIAGDASSTGWMPMSLHLDRYVYLRGRLNGQETDLLLDSGAGGTVIGAALAERMGLKTAGEITAEGVGGSQNARLVQDLEIEIGPLKLSGVHGVVIDLSEVEKMAGRTMPMILGKEVFHEFVVDIDYPDSRIAFHEPASFDYQGLGSTMPLFPGRDGHHLMELTVEGRTGRFTLDTGSGGTVDVFSAFSDEHRLLEGRSPVSEAQGGGVGGTIVSKVATLRSLGFAGFDLKEVPAAFPSEKKGAFHSVEGAGNVGAGIFGRFRLIFDYSRAQLHVEAGNGWDTKPFRKNRLGLSGHFQDGAWIVTFVAPGSPAEKAGWKPGEPIAAVDERALTASTWADAMRLLAQLPPGKEVVFTDATGRTRPLVTADYY